MKNEDGPTVPPEMVALAEECFGARVVDVSAPTSKRASGARKRVLASTPQSGQPKTRGAVNGSVSAADVRRALALDAETRTVAMVHFGRAAGSLDRWGPSDRKRMANALIRTEDGLEAQRPTASRAAACAAIRSVRRRLEAEVWP